jgi:hypothetical protein
MLPEFKEWPKIPRWSNEQFIITEKIDGTNGCIIITEHGDIFAQSRSRMLTEGKDDKFGFCAWVNGNKGQLMQLGEGYHYGEWYGSGIQRRYGLKEKRFAMFNIWHQNIPECVEQVPLLGNNFDEAVRHLNLNGSVAVPGWDTSEGIVILSSLTKVRYKHIINE